MTQALFQTSIQSIASTLFWIGLYVGIRALPGEKSRRLRWTVGSAAVLLVWLVGVTLMAANDFFRTRIPLDSRCELDAELDARVRGREIPGLAG